MVSIVYAYKFNDCNMEMSKNANRAAYKCCHYYVHEIMAFWAFFAATHVISFVYFSRVKTDKLLGFSIEALTYVGEIMKLN